MASRWCIYIYRYVYIYIFIDMYIYICVLYIYTCILYTYIIIHLCIYLHGLFQHSNLRYKFELLTLWGLKLESTPQVWSFEATTHDLYEAEAPSTFAPCWCLSIQVHLKLRGMAIKPISDLVIKFDSVNLVVEILRRREWELYGSQTFRLRLLGGFWLTFYFLKDSDFFQLTLKADLLPY